MSLEGKIIEFLDSEQLRVAYVRKEERDRLHVVDPRGRNLSVSSDRVVIVHRGASEDEFPGIARDLSERVVARQREVDVELLWQSLDSSHRELPPTELAKLFFAEATPETASAMFRALAEDTLFFKRKGALFVAKTEEQVGAERTRRQRQRKREEFREYASALILRLLKKKDDTIPADAEPILDRIHNWMRYKTGDEIGALLEELVGPAKARDTAYEILMRAGKVNPATDRFLITAGIDPDFPPQVEKAVGLLRPAVHVSSRVDYQSNPAFTIDDEDTLEVDDALTVVRSGAETVVGIHIADVSTYVERGDLLDTEASRRSSTIYLPTMSVRMFPERLSTDLASLNVGAPRPAFTVEVRFDEFGNRIGYRIALSTITVQKRFSYDNADHLLETGDGSLQILHQIAKVLQEARAQRGAITFRRPELKIRVEGDHIEIKKINPNSPSRFLVSEMMILANGLSADFASANSLPVIYRTQEPREAVAVDGTIPVEALAFDRLRKTFKRSRLSLTPALHSGLGLSAYTQVSSPIRRYADLVTQRQFTAMLSGRLVPHSREELLQVLATAESVEQEIRTIEERSTNYWLLEYLSNYKKGVTLQAVVLDQKGNVELQDYYLKAKISGSTKVEPGETIEVQIENVDSARGDVRLRLA